MTFEFFRNSQEFLTDDKLIKFKSHNTYQVNKKVNKKVNKQVNIDNQ